MIPESAVQAILPRTRATSNVTAILLATTAFLFFVPAIRSQSTILSQFSRSALNDFLAGRIAPEVTEFGEIKMTRQDVLAWMQKARTARQAPDRGIAIANLQNCAWILLDVPETKPVAMELLNTWVLPHVTSLRTLPRTSSCSYENVVFGVYACYRQAGDVQGQRRVLDLLSTQAREPGLRDLAVLRLAGLKAAEGNLREAIELARRADARGEFSKARAQLMATWQEDLKEKRKR
jgi:hypothetical protein